MGFETVLASASLASQGLSLLSGFSQRQAADSNARQEAAYNAEISARNARAAELARVRELEISQREEQTADIKAAGLLGLQRAQQGASGLSLESGSLLSLREASRVAGRLDTLNIRNRAETSAHDFARQRDSFSLRSDLSRRRSRQSSSTNNLISLIGGAASLGQKAYKRFKPRDA